MSYIFKGKLWDKTESTLEPLSDVMIRLYQSQKTDSNNPSCLIAESKTDANGNFVIEIKDYRPLEQELKVDILCERIQGHSSPSHLHPKINFKSMTINPGRSKLKMESFRMGTITFLSIFSAA